MNRDISRILFQGLVAGLMGYLSVMLVMAVASVASGQSPFYFAAVLGATLFYGVTDVAAITVAPGYVLAYNGIHMLVFVAFGIVSAWLASYADRGAQLWYLGLFAFMFIAFHIIGAVQMVAAPVADVIPAIALWGSGLAAGGAMAAYLLRVHPRLRAPQSWAD
jgi:hypothetical protein